MNEKTILAIDASTKSTGIAVFKDKDLIYYDCIVSSSTNLYNRIDVMVEGLEKVLDKYKIDLIVIEDVLPDEVGGNQNTYKALTYLQGFFFHLFDKYKIKHKFFVSSQWRKRCGIKTGPGIHRETLKKKDMEFVKNTYGLDVNDDIADAICIGHAEIQGDIPIKQEFADFEFK